MSTNAKIEAALALLNGCPQHAFADLAVLAADQAGLDAEDQDWLRKELSCRVCGDAEICDRGLCLPCEEWDSTVRARKRDAAKMRGPKGGDESGDDDYAWERPALSELMDEDEVRL